MNKKRTKEQWVELLEQMFGTPEILLKRVSASFVTESLDFFSPPVASSVRVLARQALLNQAGEGSTTAAYAVLWDISHTLFGRTRYPSEITELCWEVFSAVCTFFSSPIPSREEMESIIYLDSQLTYERIEEMWSLSSSYTNVSSYADTYAFLEQILEGASQATIIHEQESRTD